MAQQQPVVVGRVDRPDQQQHGAHRAGEDDHGAEDGPKRVSRLILPPHHGLSADRPLLAHWPRHRNQSLLGPRSSRQCAATTVGVGERRHPRDRRHHIRVLRQGDPWRQARARHGGGAAPSASVRATPGLLVAVWRESRGTGMPTSEKVMAGPPPYLSGSPPRGNFLQSDSSNGAGKQVVCMKPSGPDRGVALPLHPSGSSNLRKR